MLLLTLTWMTANSSLTGKWLCVSSSCEVLTNLQKQSTISNKSYNISNYGSHCKKTNRTFLLLDISCDTFIRIYV